MKRLISVFLVIVMLCCCAASAETFKEKASDLVSAINQQMYDMEITYDEDLFDVRFEKSTYEIAFFDNESSLELLLTGDPATHDFTTCSIATTDADNLFFALYSCSFLPHVTLFPEGDSYVDMDDPALNAYLDLVDWCDLVHNDTYNALCYGQRYTSPSLRTDYFTVALNVVYANGEYAAIINYSFEDSHGYGPIADTMYVVNCQEWVSLRRSSNSNSDRLAEVPFGAKVTGVQDMGNGFYRCTYRGITGYIQARYLSTVMEYAPVQDYSTPYKGTVEQPWPDDDFWTMYPDYVSFNGIRYQSGSKTKTVGDYLFSVGSYTYKVVNCDSYVTLREEANAYSDAVREVSKGAKVQVNGELNGWMLCRYDSRYGWIKSGYLKAN